MPRATTCPELHQYQRLASGQLSDAEREVLLKHLEDCDACAARLNALPEQDTLVGLIRQGQKLGDVDSGEAVARLVERLSKLRPSDAPAGSEQPTLPPAESTPARSLTFACPACGKTLKVKGELAGMKGKCPHCKQTVRVPAKSATASLPSKPGSLASAEARTRINAAGKAENTMDQPSAAAGDQGLYDFLAPPQAADELGRLGPYRVLRVLGAGGMGVVFRAEDPQLERLVALKAMLPSLAASASSRQRFLREAKAAAAINHDHIVTIYQVGEDRGVPFLAMQFLEGEPLDARLKREGKLPAAEVLRIGREVALGLAAAHKRQLIHRDIKPANVWLEAETGRVKILDFGLARAVGDDAHLTQQGAIMGTPAYMAPEQAQGKGVDHRCDLFSLGCVLYRLAAGEAPFRGTDAISTLMSVAMDTPRPPHELAPDLPRALSELIQGLLAKAPGDRPKSAQAVVETLEGVAAWRNQRLAARRPAQAVAEAPEGVASVGAARRRGAPSKRKARPDSPYRLTARLFREKWPILAGAAACLLLLGLAGLWAAGVFKLKTQDGTIVVDNLPADAEVFVDGEKIALQLTGDGKPIEIRVAPGKRTLEIKAAGVTMETREVTLASGERKPIGIRLEPPAVASEKPAPPTLPATDEKGFVSLFNGKDLTGWTALNGAPPAWEVKDGYMEVVPGKGDIRTKETFGPDFKLHVEFWLPLMADKKDQGRANSGVFLQGRYEVQILDSYKNDTHVAGSVGSLYGIIAPDKEAQQNAIRPPEQWQSYDITFHAPRVDETGKVTANGRITVVLNGVAVINYGQFDRATVGGTEDKLGTPGPIRLQDHGARVRFRNIGIEALPLADAATPPAPAADGFVPLFNGKDLTGWKTHPSQPGNWRVENGILIGSSGGVSHLYTERGDYTDFHLRLEARLNLGDGFRSTGVYFRAPFGPNPTWVSGYNAKIDANRLGGLLIDLNPELHRMREPVLRPGEWITYEIIAEGNHFVIKVNGETTSDYTDERRLYTKGHIVLQQHGAATVAEFRKVEIKELTPR